MVNDEYFGKDDVLFVYSEKSLTVVDSQKTPLNPDKIQVMAQTERNLRKLEVFIYQGKLYEKVFDPGDRGSVPGKTVLPEVKPRRVSVIV